MNVPAFWTDLARRPAIHLGEERIGCFPRDFFVKLVSVCCPPWVPSPSSPDAPPRWSVVGRVLGEEAPDGVLGSSDSSNSGSTVGSFSANSIVVDTPCDLGVFEGEPGRPCSV